MWTDSVEEAFQQLKQAVTSAPVLWLPNPDLPYLVATDASKLHVGAVLSQSNNGETHPIAYHSRKLTPAESNYPTHEQELLAVIDALKYWRHYLLGTHTTILTDHHSLQWINPQPHLSP